MGRIFLHVMGALAEMERELIIERTRAGLAAAPDKGRIGGRRRVMTPDVIGRAERMLANGATLQQIALVLEVSVKPFTGTFRPTGSARLLILSADRPANPHQMHR